MHGMQWFDGCNILWYPLLAITLIAEKYREIKKGKQNDRKKTSNSTLSQRS